MTEQELRQLVRDVIAQRLGTDPAPPPAVMTPQPAPAGSPHHHPSQGIFQVLRSGDATSGCLIEPSVRCSHCSYCKTYGH